MPDQTPEYTKLLASGKELDAMLHKLAGEIIAAHGAALAAAPALQGNLGGDGKAHIGEIHRHMPYLIKQGLFNAKIVAFFFSLDIIFPWLIQSQRQTGAASAAGGEKNTNTAGRVIVEIGVQFFFRGIGYRDHSEPP
jgi:hypothetical protein